MSQTIDNIVELHNAMLRARALGFDKTADAMRHVLDELAADAAIDSTDSSVSRDAAALTGEER